jgi:hypothetical protein
MFILKNFWASGKEKNSRLPLLNGLLIQENRTCFVGGGVGPTAVYTVKWFGTWCFTVPGFTAKCLTDKAGCPVLCMPKYLAVKATHWFGKIRASNLKKKGQRKNGFSPLFPISLYAFKMQWSAIADLISLSDTACRVSANSYMGGVDRYVSATMYGIQSKNISLQEI